ncbi:MAG: OmpH family outer membrane protein [bacterium]|nr:OmpH family outer membrane protein [bacterium]
MKKRLISFLVATVAAVSLVVPSAIAADLTDVGFLDQAQLASLPVFQRAQGQLAQYQSQLRSQYDGQYRAAKTDADKQRVAMAYQQAMSDKQRELIGPLYARAQMAIANVADSKHLSIVVDKRIVVYGGQDITKDVISLVTSSKAITPPATAAPSSEIGFVDQTALETAQKVKDAADQLAKYQADQQKVYGEKLKGVKGDVEKQQIIADYNKAMQDKRNQLLTPLIDQTKSATQTIAKSKNLLLVIDRADVVYGGTDITQDVQNALGK